MHLSPDIYVDHSKPLSERIRAAAHSLGCDQVGFSSVRTLEDESAGMARWLESGMHAGMTYLERNNDKRRDPTLILEGARSIIVVTKNYYTNHTHNASTDRGKISRYAWGDDYHDVLGATLDKLVHAISEMAPNSRSRRYVDTGPIMEKQWAVHAGIGWQGKHSNIISLQRGSYFFLGVILTTLELGSDLRVEDHCGTCTACLDACPTHAIVEPYVVDSRRCISYWTIESKATDDIPPDVLSHVDGWMYGCDVCQDVCPWNRFKHDCHTPEFEPRDRETSLAINEVLSWTQEQFSSRFKNSPVKRAKILGMQRNARALTEYYRIASDLDAV